MYKKITRGQFFDMCLPQVTYNIFQTNSIRIWPIQILGKTFNYSKTFNNIFSIWTSLATFYYSKIFLWFSYRAMFFIDFPTEKHFWKLSFLHYLYQTQIKGPVALPHSAFCIHVITAYTEFEQRHCSAFRDIHLFLLKSHFWGITFI